MDVSVADDLADVMVDALDQQLAVERADVLVAWSGILGVDERVVPKGFW